MDRELDYEEYERDWKRRHKSSLPRKQKVSSLSALFWIGFWIIVALGAALFSAAHTIPAAELTLFSSLNNRSTLANTAFIIVEAVIFGASAKRHEIRWLGWLLAAAMAVALVGNISSSVRAVAENGGDGLNQVAGVLLSVIAPFTALAAGEVLHVQLTHLSAKRREAEDDFQTRWKDIEARINAAWTKELKEAAKRENSRKFMKSDALQAVHEVSRTPPKPRVKLHEVAKAVRENGDEGLSVGELMRKYDISQGSTTKIREILQSSNGNGRGGHGD